MTEEIKDETYFRLKEEYLSELQRLKQENEKLNTIIYQLERKMDAMCNCNKELKHRNENLRIALSTYQMPEVVKVLTDWRTGELQLQENKLKNYRKALEEIRENLVKLKTNDEDDFTYEYSKIEDKINEVLNV